MHTRRPDLDEITVTVHRHLALRHVGDVDAQAGLVGLDVAQELVPDGLLQLPRARGRRGAQRVPLEIVADAATRNQRMRRHQGAPSVAAHVEEGAFGRHAERGEGVGHGLGPVRPQRGDGLVGVGDVDARVAEAGDVGLALNESGSSRSDRQSDRESQGAETKDTQG